MWCQIISSSSQTAISPCDDYLPVTTFCPCPEVVIISDILCILFFFIIDVFEGKIHITDSMLPRQMSAAVHWRKLLNRLISTKLKIQLRIWIQDWNHNTSNHSPFAAR